MATMPDPKVSLGRLPVLRCAGVGAIVLGVLFVLCWLAQDIGGLGASHMFIAIFTIAPGTSIEGVAVGLFWSVIVGGFSGALTAWSYNTLGSLRR